MPGTMHYALIYEGVQHSDRANNVPLNPLLTLRLPSAAGVRLFMYTVYYTAHYKSKLDKVKFAVFYLCTSVQLCKLMLTGAWMRGLDKLVDRTTRDYPDSNGRSHGSALWALGATGDSSPWLRRWG